MLIRNYIKLLENTQKTAKLKRGARTADKEGVAECKCDKRVKQPNSWPGKVENICNTTHDTTHDKSHKNNMKLHEMLWNFIKWYKKKWNYTKLHKIVWNFILKKQKKTKTKREEPEPLIRRGYVAEPQINKGRAPNRLGIAGSATIAMKRGRKYNGRIRSGWPRTTLHQYKKH